MLSRSWGNETIEVLEPIPCEVCPAGTYAEKIVELSDFDKLPAEFPILTCTAVTGQKSFMDCQEETLEFWSLYFGRLSFSQIPAGMMFGLGGNFMVEDEHGGSIAIDYTTENLLT